MDCKLWYMSNGCHEGKYCCCCECDNNKCVIRCNQANDKSCEHRTPRKRSKT